MSTETKKKINNCFLLAMAEEFNFFKEKNKLEPIDYYSDFDMYYFKDNLFVITGIGLVNAANAFSYCQNNFDIDLFINIGLAGSVNDKHKILDVLIVDELFYSTVDLTAFGYSYGQLPGNSSSFSVEKNELDKIKKLININQSTKIASSDIFINSYDIMQYTIGKLGDKDISLFDMESCALAQSAKIYKKRISFIKVVSDILGDTENSKQFDEILYEGSKKISTLIEKIIN